MDALGGGTGARGTAAQPIAPAHRTRSSSLKESPGGGYGQPYYVRAIPSRSTAPSVATGRDPLPDLLDGDRRQQAACVSRGRQPSGVEAIYGEPCPGFASPPIRSRSTATVPAPTRAS